MISINGRIVNPEELSKEITNSEQKVILKQMAGYPVIFYYESLQQLKFELLFRVNTIKAANDLDKSGAKFTTFAYSFPNRKLWYRLPNGGFLLREGIYPSEGIEDLVKNGKLYAFECSTAIAIVLYIAVLYTIGPRAFNTYFSRLYLMDWQFDEDLPVYNKEGEDFIIGDVLHFKNPEFDPQQPWWRAENVIFVGDDKFYGHGIGIRDSKTIINFLNGKRKENSNESAYLMRMITRPNYKTISLLR
ncbi:protein-glutamine gamma-glutamyltransferase [Neobacillus niacini]|uniref:protein-glutamine gamma-glutamyltransferase n=1 Tax=Neobacillus niacini TaxID=86668 RepID=UPI002FFF4EA4